MRNEELIGAVVAAHLQEKISDQDDGGTARFLIDCLTADQTAAIAKKILNDKVLSELIEIKLPVHFVGHHALPTEVLTKERTTYFRNAACSKSALLVANTGDDEEQSLKELEPIGSPQLLEKTELWVRVAAAGLSLSKDHLKWWNKALEGLLEVRYFTLERFSAYVLSTRSAIKDEGHPILSALGFALSALRIPRDTEYFNTLNKKIAGHRDRWRRLFNNAIKKRACYLLKQTPSQGLLTKDILLKSFENKETKDAIPVGIYPHIQAFISEDSGWNDAAYSLSTVEWESVKPLFEKLKKKKSNLGEDTIAFYDELGTDDYLSDEEQEYLTHLSKRKTNECQEEDEEFYQKHRIELKDHTALKAKWDQSIYGSPVETDDFLVGIALCLESLFDLNIQASEKRLVIRCDRRSKKDLKSLNNEAGRFFVHRYRGLQALFGNKVRWNVGELFEFDDLDQEWRAAKKRWVCKSIAKAALKIKFFLELEVESITGNTDTFSKQLIWTFNPNAVTRGLRNDWLRLCENPLMICCANREPSNEKGRFQSIALEDVKSLRPTFDQNRGSFVAVYKKANDISALWPANLAHSLKQSLISEQTAKKLRELFETFKENYSLATQNFIEAGLGSDLLLRQSEDYSRLLDAICKEARGDKNRELLLRPLLRLGTVEVEGGTVASVVAPWHPLRLAAVARKARQVASLLKFLMTADEISFGDPRLFFKDLRDELTHPYYPEIVLGWNKSTPELLSLSDSYLDYSLHESPVVSNQGEDDTNENPAKSSDLIHNVVKRFLTLYPHEKSNLSLVLYNSDSARLPHAVVGKINNLHDNEKDMRCEIILRHRNGNKLRELYAEIVESADNDADSFIASEVAKDFMARLRISIMADQAPIPDPTDGPPTDIVFLQDVIARHARTEWYPENAKPVDASTFIPARWSRRRPSATDDMKSIVYLCCPVQSKAGWSFITALTTFLKGDWDGNETKRLLPARQLDFSDNETAAIFKEIHNLGNWVVNFDELLDRRQLLNQNVRVIRYKQFATQGRNLFISSNAPFGLLSVMILSRIKALNLDLSEGEDQNLADKFISDAIDISGDIVLRAAKRGRNASELMGVVLSRYMIRQELMDGYIGWYFLDDYAEWLGQREQQIADILALKLEQTPDGKMALAVIVSESKYVEYSGLTSSRKKSQKQLRDTVRRISDALFGDPKRLDRDLWLARFSDLVLNGIQFPAGSDIDLSAWRRGIREGECEIYLRGYSYVFVSGPSDSPECSDFAEVANLENSYQEVFSRHKLRELVKAYQKGSDPLSIRKDVADKDVWKKQTFHPPSDQIDITIQKNETKKYTDTHPPINSDETETDIDAGISGATDNETHRKKSENMSDTPPWIYPAVTHLIESYKSNGSDSAEDKEWLDQTANLCKGALQQFQLRSKLLEKTLTPNAALLKFQGSANLTVDQVLRRQSEMLTTHKLKVISVEAEPGEVVIAIARPKRRVLHLPEVWKRWASVPESDNHKILIGVKEDDSNLLFFSPKNNAPHTLIAGSTGSGKSVLMQNIILSIASMNTPEQAKITLIDPKLGVDYFAFEGLPHLQDGIIDEPENAIETLNMLVDEMNRRYTVIRQNRVSNIYDLNKKENATEHFPFLWIIHDEFAEWMMTREYSQVVSDIVGRLGVKARAAGISLIFAAQRPEARVMPTQLRANLGNRLILRVDSEGTSKIALEEKGAEHLLGKGHLMAKLEGEDGLIMAQVPFIDSDELEEMVSLFSG